MDNTTTVTKSIINEVENYLLMCDLDVSPPFPPLEKEGYHLLLFSKALTTQLRSDKHHAKRKVKSIKTLFSCMSCYACVVL